jgi:hypothetical protein
MMERRVAAGRIKRAGMSLIVAALAATAFNVSTAMARHQWSNYHWEFPSGLSQLTIYVNDCQDGTPLYDYNIVDHFSGPNNDWDGVINAQIGAIDLLDGSCPIGLSTPSDPIASFDSRVTAYNATNSSSTGEVNAFNADYADTGWVGVAIVELAQSSGDNHIVYGEVHLNDYYAGLYSIYNNASVMRKVQCQEVGHIFGLDHVKKDNSCMYSSMAFIGSTITPNGHDGDMVNQITHGHDADASPPSDGGGGGGSFCDKNPDHWKCQAAGGVFRGKATWAEAYDSRDDMFEAADVVVSARVLNGSMFDRVVGAPGRGLPVSQAVLQIQETFKGNATGVIRIEHTRGLGLEIEDDPGYVNGDDYMLFLRQIGARTFRVVNPQGRIQQ